MFTSPAESWDRVRQTFADQFEGDGINFVYRRSQKGEAIRVSADERSKFVDEFDRNVRRAKWIIYIGLTVALGGVVLLTLLSGSDLSQLAIVVGIGFVLIPYFAYYRWAWLAPARELAGRTPIAGERSSEEVRRLRFQRMTYGQLAGAAFGGLLIPFIGSAHQDVFSGWNRLWLVFGGALVLLATVHAFRKWRFEQEDSYKNVIPAPSNRNIARLADDSSSQTNGQLRRYVLIGALVLGLAFVFLTPAGKRLAQSPSFWPFLLIGCGAWSLFTVVQGFAKGQIEPFARGFYNTYERETQPKRFWASMGWNSILGCLCLWLAFQMNAQNEARIVQDRCYNEKNAYSQGDVTSACNQLLEASGAAIRARPSDADAYFERGYAYEHRGELQNAIADFSEVIRRRPNSAGAYYYRWAAYKDLGDDEKAAADLAALDRLDPKLAAALRGNR